MERYDYYEAVKADVENYIEENINIKEYEDRRELKNFLNEELWNDDSVTGNASGSYTFNTWQAEENLCHNNELLNEALDEFGERDNMKDAGAEALDVTICCYLLADVISDILDEMYSDNNNDDDIMID